LGVHHRCIMRTAPGVACEPVARCVARLNRMG
jgi:hypothetical protein